MTNLDIFIKTIVGGAGLTIGIIVGLMIFLILYSLLSIVLAIVTHKGKNNEQ